MYWLKSCGLKEDKGIKLLSSCHWTLEILHQNEAKGVSWWPYFWRCYLFKLWKPNVCIIFNQDNERLRYLSQLEFEEVVTGWNLTEHAIKAASELVFHSVEVGTRDFFSTNSQSCHEVHFKEKEKKNKCNCNFFPIKTQTFKRKKHEVHGLERELLAQCTQCSCR